jgi:hypothetical protein
MPEPVVVLADVIALILVALPLSAGAVFVVLRLGPFQREG